MTPEGWRYASIESVCSKVTSGGTPSRKRPDFYGGHIPWVKTQELQDGWVRSTGEHLTQAGLASSSAKLLPANTILMAMYGATVGKLGLLADEMACNQASCALTVNPSVASFRFIFYRLLLERAVITNLATGAAQQNLNAGTIKSANLLLPPVEEQERIAGVLGAFDDLIETNRRLTRSLEHLIHGLFTQERFDEPLSGVQAVALRELIAVNPKIAKPKGDAPYVDMSMLPTDSALLGPPMVRPAAGGAKFQNGDTLLARITPCLENGKTAYVSNLDESTVAVGSTEFIVLRGLNDTRGIWAYALTRSPRFRAFAIQQLGDGSSGRQRLSAEAVGDYRVPQPTADALIRFRQNTDPLVKAMIGLHDEALDLTRQRDQLLPLLMSGRVRVRDVEASVS